jgi:NAD(P)-dependent dehydrogenase (short-subunit alcohol dehydrogenase family)
MVAPSNGMSLLGKRAIVSGGARGIGGAVVEGYARAGARVVSLDVRAHEHDALEKSARERVRSGTCDVSDGQAVRRAVDDAVEWLGGVDVLVNTAAIFPGNPAEAIPQDEWDRVFAVNVRGTVLINQAVFKYMKATGGKILNFGSIAGLGGMSGMASYASSKAAIHGWTWTIAREWAKYNITANIIAPAMLTPGSQESYSELTEEQRAAAALWLQQTVPLGGQLGEAGRDLVPYMIFLASDGANFVTGAVIRIDGGMICVP